MYQLPNNSPIKKRKKRMYQIIVASLNWYSNENNVPPFVGNLDMVTWSTNDNKLSVSLYLSLMIARSWQLRSIGTRLSLNYKQLYVLC